MTAKSARLAGTALVKSKGANNRSISLEGFAGGVRDHPGQQAVDLVWQRQGLFAEAMEDAAAEGLGDTSEFEVQPFLPAGIAVGNMVSLVKPPAKYQIVAGSYRPASGRGNISSGISFSMVSVP